MCVPQVVVNKFEVANELNGLDCLSMLQNHLQLTPETAATGGQGRAGKEYEEETGECGEWGRGRCRQGRAFIRPCTACIGPKTVRTLS